MHADAGSELRTFKSIHQSLLDYNKIRNRDKMRLLQIGMF